MSNAGSEDEQTLTAKLRELHDVTRGMMEAESKDELFHIVTASASQLLGFDYNTVRRHDTDDELLVPVAASPALRDETGKREPYERGETIQWEAIENEKLLVFQEISEIDDDIERSGGGSMIIVPLSGYGVLTLGSPQRQDIDESDVELARVFGANIETAIERLEQLQALEEREQELAEKNERLDQFASKVSHELRNPLNVIAGQVDLARTRDDPSHFDKLEQSINRMNKLVDDILAFARRGDVSLEPEWHSLHDIANDCWDAVPTQDTRLRVETTDRIYADGDRLRQLLGNLFRNAVEHAGDGVTVTVGDLENGFFIEDDGRGIPEQERSQVLDAGMAKQAHWTGLGLRIVSQIAEAHDWSIRVTESDGGGARFEFVDVEMEHTENKSLSTTTAQSNQPDPEDLQRRIRVTRESAATGAEVAMELFRTAIEIETKSGKTDLVTRADRTTQSSIVERIKETYPDAAIVGEEADAKKRIPEDGTAWIIDPIDGTNNFVRGNRRWTTSVACLVEDKPVAAVNVLPALGDTYVATDAGVWLNGEPISVSDRTDPERFVVIPGIWWDFERRDEYAVATTEIVRQFGDLRRTGSTQASLSMLASGQLEGVVTNVDTHPWDTVAGVMMVRQAGGTVTDIHGDEWQYDSMGLVASNGQAHEYLLDVAQQITREKNIKD